MYKHILLPTDGSELSAKAEAQAMKLAKSLGANLTVINVIPEFPDMGLDESHAMPTPAIVKKRFQEESAEDSERLLGKVQTEARGAGVDCRVVSVPAKQPYDAIIKQAEKANCDLIVMASHGRNVLSGILLGSETNKVLAPQYRYWWCVNCHPQIFAPR
jgi:nucleotide-binding universal stress UspA family protein